MTYEPRPEHRFSFGLWTVGNIGIDPFGEPVREVLSPVQLVELLAEVGAWGVNLHDNDLVPIDASAHERDQIISDFRKALDATGLVVPMATTNLFKDPIFRDGAFTAHDPRVRAFALQKTMRAIDLGVELGATTYVFWGGREGVETDAAKDPLVAFERYREGMNFLCAYVRDRGYDQHLRFGSGNPKAAFFLVKLLGDVGYAGSRHFDAHAYRTSDYEDVKAFARGCMRTYLILKEKAERWNADPEIQALVVRINEDDGTMA